MLPSSRGSARGLSLAELLVAGSLLVLLSAVFAAFFGQARSASQGGMERIAMRAVHRQAQKRLSILLRSTMAPNEVDPSIVEPAYQEASAQLRFRAPADLIDPDISFDPRSPDYPEFTLRLEAGGGLVLQRSDLSGPTQRLGEGFATVNFERKTKRIVTVTLTSVKIVRGAAGSSKTIEESSTNAVQLPGVR